MKAKVAWKTVINDIKKMGSRRTLSNGDEVADSGESLTSAIGGRSILPQKWHKTHNIMNPLTSGNPAISTYLNCKQKKFGHYHKATCLHFTVN